MWLCSHIDCRLFLCTDCISNHEIQERVENVDTENTNARSHHTMFIVIELNSTKLNFHALPKINLVRMLPLVFLENDGKFVILSVWIHINCTALWSTGYVANLFPLFLAYARQAHPMLNCIDEVKKISDLRGPADLWVTSLMTKNVGWCLQFKLPSSWSFWEL